MSNFSGFYKEYGKALDNREAALFIGAGLSAGADFKTWPNLLREVAKDLRLDIDKETDLVALAQYHVNEKSGVRTSRNQLLIDEYKEDKAITENHKLIASLPVETVWTTNYDQLIDKAFHEAGKIYDADTSPINWTLGMLGFLLPERLFNRRRKHEKELHQRADDLHVATS